MTLLGTTETELRRRVEEAQSAWRCASVVGVVVRGGERVLDHAVGLADADTGAPPDPDTHYRIGSITKTFTAVLVMALRDEGRLRLDDPVDRHLPGGRHAALTPRQLLTHLSGLQREPVGDVWWTLRPPPDSAALLAGLEDAEAVAAPQRRWHYSNLAYAVLGELVASVDGRPWEDSLRARILEPLAMTRTSLRPSAPRAAGYLTDPFADRLLREPDMPTGALAPAAQLWSTGADLAKWGAFLADPPADVLAPDTLDEMCQPAVMWDVDAWTLGWGLGLMLLRRGDHVLVGHEGAMPGFLAGLYVRRPESVGAAVLVNATAAAAPGDLAADLVEALLTAEAPAPVPWVPGAAVDPAAESLLGSWWSEGTERVVEWRAGRLEARMPARPTRPPAVFAPEGDDVWRTVSGPETGERLVVVRDASGQAVRLHWATYGMTREPRVFGDTRDGRAGPPSA